MHKRIQQLAQCDRPREKLLAKGATSLSDFELLQVIIGSGTRGIDVGQIASSLKKLINRVGLRALHPHVLKGIPGMSTAKISNLLAAIEYIRRQSTHRGVRIATAEDVLPYVTHIRNKKQEYVLTITLDGANCVIEVRTIAIGTLERSLIHPREIFADAIAERAASIILVHNHPSGTLEPSNEDRAVTDQLAESGRLLGIPLRDHIIVTKDSYCSLRDRGFMLLSQQI